MITPIIKKFFSNKIESSTHDWGDYLLEITDTFARFDGDEYNRDLLTEQFQTISGRSPYTLRDASNFRDEFGAYGAYLGVFRIDNINGVKRLFLSNAAKHFLCSPEPDVEAFCRLQLSLFQYPNGLGYVPTQNRCQANIIKDTISEITNNIHLNPLRLLCRTILSLHDIENIKFEDIILPYELIFLLFNDKKTNQEYSPSYDNILSVVKMYGSNTNKPAWLSNKTLLTNFKRNFHILERTGIFIRNGHTGIKLADYDYDKVYDYVKDISNMKENFDGFELDNLKENLEENIKLVVMSSSWGKYYDSLNLPICTISNIANEIEFNESLHITEDNQNDNIEFPDFKSFKNNEPKTFCSNNINTDPFQTLILREKANREHARILSMLAALLRTNGHEPYENIFIDLFIKNSSCKIIFEVKSNNNKNTLSQVRKAISQLYEYRYKSSHRDAMLCLILQQEPPQIWIKDYLVNDRKILLGWLVDEVRLDCPPECHKILSDIGLLT